MSRGEDGPPDRHANSDSLQSAEADLAAVGTASKAEGVGGYEQLLDQYSGFAIPSEGEVVRGKVLKITPTDVLVDVGFKSEGVIPLAEFQRPDGSVEVKPGDEVDVLFESAENQQEHIVLSSEKAERISVWDQIEKAFLDQRPVSGVVIDCVKGGLSVDVGVRAFLPGSQVDIRVAEGIDGLVHVSDLSWVRKIKHPSEVLRKGQQVKALVLHIDPAGHRLSLGIKQLQPDAWKAFFSAHNVGEIVQGKVTRSTSFGVFVELEGGIEGLCHHSQIEELESGSGALSVGEVRDFRIIRLQPQEKKIGLSLKASRSVEPASAPIATIGKAIAQTASRAASRSQGPESAGKDSRSS